MNELGQSVGKIREGMSLDKSRVENYVKKIIPNLFETPIEVSQFKLGQSNPTFFIKDKKGKRFVLRKKPPGLLISKTAHAVEKEYEILHYLKDTGVPVPKEDSSVIGSPFYIMEFIEGRIFSDNFLKKVNSPQEKRNIYFSMVEALTKLHKVKPKNKKFKFYERQISGLVSISDAQAKVEANGDKVGELPRLKEMIEWFKRNAVKDEVSIIHGDYKLDNVIIHPVESKVIGILDWELSTIGHPLSDLANLLLPYYIPSSFSGFGMKSENFTAVGIPEVEELLQHYCSLMERPFPIPNWDFCVAFSCFRLSVILQGIAARVKRKQASSEQALQYAKMFKPLAKLGLEIVDRGDLVEQVIKSKI